jgi:hypothetical protein
MISPPSLFKAGIHRSPDAQGIGFIKTLLVAATMGAYIVLISVAAMNTHKGVGLGGAPLFYDFSVFYQAASFADSHRPVSAYDDNAMIGAVKAAFPGSQLRLPWNYPPTFQLLLMPFGVLPYVAAWLVWSCLLYGLYAWLIRSLAVDTWNLWILLLAPGAAVNLFFGQNGLFSVVLMGGGTLLLERRPILGGAVLGLIAYKPQLALLAPIALVFGREWRALAAAIVTELLLAALATVVMGISVWFAFLHKLMQPAAVFTTSSSDWHGIPSVLVLAKSLGLNPTWSWACHALIAAAAIAATAWVWRMTSDGKMRAAMLATGTLLATPYLRGYDLVLLVLPIAVLLPLPRKRLWENILIFLAWVTPIVLMFTAPKVQPGALVSVAMMALILWHKQQACEER